MKYRHFKFGTKNASKYMLNDGVTLVRLSLVKGLGVAILGVVGAWSNAAFADGITIGDPALTPYTLTYGDFNVISLEFADTGTGTNNYFVASSPGQLKNDVVVGTGSGSSFYNGNIAGNNGVTGMDTPLSTPNGGNPSYFNGTWNTTLSALNTALGGSLPVFYFNLNETGTADVLSGTDLLVWAHVTLSNASCIVTNSCPSVYLAGNPFDPNGPSGASLPDSSVPVVSYDGLVQSQLNGAPNQTLGITDQPSGSTYYAPDARWTYVHGDICVDGSTFEHYGSCVTGNPAAWQTINQNLGANQAAFAAYSPTLDSLINSGMYDELSINWEMAAEDNGYEQLFILPNPVPEPASLAMLVAGLFGLAFVLRRRKPVPVTVV